MSSPVLLDAEPSQMSFKAIAALLINDDAKKISSEIVSANQRIGSQTKDFEI